MKNLYLVIFGLLVFFSLEINGDHSSRVLLSRIDATRDLHWKISRALSNKITSMLIKIQCPGSVASLQPKIERWEAAILTADENIKKLRSTVEDILKEIPKIPSQSKRKMVIFFDIDKLDH